MSLKQSIVIRNEYTVRTESGGSRGGTPGSYVERYMNRDDASETLTPVRLHGIDDYALRYMTREDATEVAGSAEEVRRGAEDAELLGGRAFGRGKLSLANDEVKLVSRRIQKAFDEGHTVFKTILSFDEEYLREMGIVDENFHCVERGDYRGNIDQMKLRCAINEGLERMGRHFDDLDWIGVIQVDTRHVHADLAMVDGGHNLEEGAGRGVLNDRDKMQLRRGIDMSLGRVRDVHLVTSNISQDRRNLRMFVKRFAHRAMEREGAAQFLLACLPENKRLWRAGSKAKDMRKPNRVVREFVHDLFMMEESGYDRAVRDVADYVRIRAEREGLDAAMQRKLYDDGISRIEETCMNAVYETLKDLPDAARRVETPMLDVMSADLPDMGDMKVSDPLVEFGFRLSNYSARLRMHKDERRRWKDQVERYKAAENPAPESEVFLRFAENEVDWNEKCMAKYQHFLWFLPQHSYREEDLEELQSLWDESSNLNALIEDVEGGFYLVPVNADEAEEDVFERYHVGGGRFAANNLDILRARRDSLSNRLEQFGEELDFDGMEEGLSLEFSPGGFEDTSNVLHVSESHPEVAFAKRIAYPFDEVKALDIHHLLYDFPFDFEVSYPNAQAFIEAADRRAGLLADVVDYFERTNQEYALDALPVADIEAMRSIADNLRDTDVLESRRAVGSQGVRRVKTTSLDDGLVDDLEESVLSALREGLRELS